MRARAACVLLALLPGSLLVAACGDDDATEPEESGEVQAVAGGDELSQTWPLTGLPVEGDLSAAQTHPVMVLKMDNSASSAPQAGLSNADLVVEELVEGGMTRLAVMYYSDIPGSVGPVRSMRASDIGIVAPVDGVMVTSGAAQVTINRIDAAGIEYVAEGSPGFYRDSARYPPYNLMTDLSESVAALEQHEEIRPVDYLPWGSEDDFPKGQAARSISASFSGGHTTNWTYRGGTYVNENTYAAAGDEFPADSVVVLRVQVGDAGYRDPAGNPVPETILEGKGQALIFHGGRLLRGTWSKDSVEDPIELSTKAGELTVPAGHTWIELVPIDGGAVTFKK